LARGRAWLRKQNERDRSEAKQNGDYEAEFEECGLRSGFLFHWMEFGLSGAFAGTLQARINVVFLGG
jgi:hypothetical protein